MQEKEPRSSSGVARPIKITTGTRIKDGASIELLAGSNGDDLNLLLWDRTNAVIGHRVEHCGTTYEPATIDASIRRAVRLPSGVAEFGSTRDLFSEICGVIAQSSNLADEAVSLSAHFVCSTWFPERTGVAPFLFVNSSATAGRASFLRLLDALCMHPIKLTEIKAADFRSLPLDLRLTVLMDVAAPKPSLLQILRASNQPDFCVSSGGTFVNLFCAKVLCSQEPLKDPASLDFPLQISLPPAASPIPHFNQDIAETIAAEFQPKLLQYRLTQLNEATSAPTLDVKGLTDPIAMLARTLAAGVSGDESLRSGLVALLRTRDCEISAERSAGLEAVVVEALLFCCHDGNRSAVRVKELTDYANEILRGRGVDHGISPESVGWRLRGLGFHTQAIGSAGKGISLDGGTVARIHRLARDFEVRSLESGSRCPSCVPASGADAANGTGRFSSDREPDDGMDLKV